MSQSRFGYSVDRIASIADELFELSDQKMSVPRKEGAWSRKEILGHLIDSASVNHQRVIESMLNDSIVFDGYKHKQWVKLNGYQEMEWEEIVTLWCSYNMLLSGLVERIPSEILEKIHDEHSYERTAFRELPSDQSSTLGYLIEDYFSHMQYHLDQIS